LIWRPLAGSVMMTSLSRVLRPFTYSPQGDMTDNKTLANRRNALLSTGPQTAAGRARVAKNALAHGLYAVTVVPALGETPAALAELCAAVRRALRPEGVLEERLCDRIALLLLRLDRVARFEVAVASRDAMAAIGAVNAPDPDTITGDGIDICRPPHPEAAPVFRLAHARARLEGWVPVRDAFRIAVAALASETEPGATISGRGAERVVFAVGAALEWNRDRACERWSEVAGSPHDPISTERFRGAVRALAVAAGREPDETVGVVREYLVARAAEYDGPIAEKEAEAEALAAELRGARERAASAAVFADAKAVDTVIRMEGHLTRQLGLTIDLLDQLRGDRSSGDRAGLTGLFRELAGGSRPLIVG
jgi:hypothetical protein